MNQISKEKAREENREVRTVREAHMMMLLKHPNIVGLKDLVIQGPYFYILMDYVSGGQLLHYIVKRQRLSDRRTRLFSRQIVSALDYLHRNSIVHRDLKIENIMIDKSGRQIKIIDFGLSNLFCPERLLTTYCGSLYFAAPELLKANPYSGPEVDIWSLGVVIYVMATGSVPFDDKSMPGLHEKIKKGHVDYPSHLSEDCKHLLSSIFTTDPVQRIIMTDIIHHPWINKDAAPIKNYLPPRKTITLPLDLKLVERMSQGFDLGSPEEIEEKLNLIVQSPIYHDALQAIANTKLSSHHETADGVVYDGPQSVPAAYHPYLALYHLAAEKQVSQEHATAYRTLSIKRSLSSKGSIESMGGTSSARSSQASLVDESGPRLLTEVPINQTAVAGTSTAIISSNYLSRIQRWLRSSVSQHQLPIESQSQIPPVPPILETYAPSVVEEAEEEEEEEATSQDITTYYIDNEEEMNDNNNNYNNNNNNTTTTASAGSGAPQGSKSLFRKLSKAILRKESSKSLDKKPHTLSVAHSSETLDEQDIPPPVPPKDPNYTRAQVPPGMSMATVTSRQTAHTVDLNTAMAQAKEKQPSPQVSRSASLAAPSSTRRNRKGSVNRLTGKIGSWLSRSASVKHNS
ncbi:hypothetical protein G6F56_009266 [Rhizopus delemar]|nr:hypothetical protein G6F56_009266 [Rhizopus delemar]